MVLTDGNAELARMMDFDHVVRVEADGTFADNLHGTPPAPDSPTDPDINSTAIEGCPDWTLITSGLTGQHGYNGPWLHDSEQLEGGVAERVFEHAASHGGGFYVAIYAQYSCEECGGAGLVRQDDEEVECPAKCEPGETDIEGWAIAYRPLTIEGGK